MDLPAVIPAFKISKQITTTDGITKWVELDDKGLFEGKIKTKITKPYVLSDPSFFCDQKRQTFCFTIAKLLNTKNIT